ncbi:transporter, major facilitator family protein [Oesophagostomum dentatum]|uniref:Transporter, major facilitator family protein n=1 Tax=Oesophagostomum dentatum TaxID=61180 RepID=A0A0B1TKX6_OESDE|nr:transporter, major facilitator family protein [Oesophagostomum dentatum]
MSIEKRQRVMLVLCLIFGLWHLGTQWTTTLLSFLQWDTVEVMTIVDLGYIQAFGSVCNAIGALAFGQMADSTGPKAMFMLSCIFTAIYYSGISLAKSWYAFFFLQLLRVGYQLDGTAEMYLATVTTERERTGALMKLTFPQAIAMFVGPIIGSKIAAYTSLRISQFICGVALLATLMPVLMFFLPTTHSVPRLATARLRPQDYWPMIKKNTALKEGLILRALVVSSYVCFEMISRNFLLRSYMRDTNDSAIVLLVMAGSLLGVQFVILPILQRKASPRTLLQIAMTGLIICYFAVSFTTSFEQLLVIVSIQTGAYAIAYAESCTQITSAVEITDLGKATGLASTVQWISHFVLPIYASHLVEHYHFNYAFYTSTLLSIVGLAYVSVVAKNTNNRLASTLPSLTTVNY